MPMLKDPSRKYKSFKPIPLRDREWPDKTITKVPRWLATDLRDGNQSLPSPLDGEQKLRYFQLLVELGYKEIEVSFPSASQIDYDFTRHLIETPGLVPEDVWLQVISPCREDFIKRTAQSVYGAKKAIFHLYLATSECFRRVVFSNMTEDETLELAVKSTKLARSLTKDSQDPNVRATQWQYEFTTETFSDTSLDYIIRLCNAVKDAWEPTAENPIIFNLPATVELSTPNIYADQIEYFCRNISERGKVCVCLHPHNDRGCAVAASELAQMAGADRIEGCLFGNGERTGNVDLVTLALNLYTQGISPGLDFSNMSKVISTVEELTKISVHARAPYAGQFAFCAFSGSHQDAIKKGFQSREKHPENERWVMPYLPLDPQDVGRTYEAVIRVNSQSGKGGAAWVVLQRMQLDLPRGLQVAFSKVVQKYSESANRELQPTEIVKLFEDTYFLRSTNVFRLVNYHIRTNRPASRGRFRANGNKRPVESQSDRHFEGVVALDGVETSISGTGNGAISSLVNALAGVGVELTVKDYKGQVLNSNKGKNMKSVAYIECSLANGNNGDRSIWGVGINESAEQAGLIALLNAASSLRPFVSSLPNRNLTMGAAGADCLKSKGPQTTVIITEIVNDVD